MTNVPEPGIVDAANIVIPENTFRIEKGIVPYHNAMLPSEIEEERRLLYVAIFFSGSYTIVSDNTKRVRNRSEVEIEEGLTGSRC